MPDLFPETVGKITILDQIGEVQREIAVRERVYPSWIQRGTLKQETADRNLARMRKVLETLQNIRDKRWEEIMKETR